MQSRQQDRCLKLKSVQVWLDQLATCLLSCGTLVVLSSCCALHGSSGLWLLLLWNENRIFVCLVRLVFQVDIVIKVRVPILGKIVLDGEQVMAFRLHPLEECFLLLCPKIFLVLLLITTQALLLRKLALKSALLSFSCWVWRDTSPPEEVEHLAGYFFQGLLSEHHGVISELAEWHELNNISSHLLIVALGEQRHLVSIKLIHG